MRTDLFTIPALPTFEQFISELKSGNRDIGKLLPNKHSFEELPFEQLLSDFNDLEAGVNRVQTNVANIHFGVFNAVQIKHHDNKDITLEFYAFSPSLEEIKDITGVLFTEFGIGRFHRSPVSPGNNIDRFNITELTSSITEPLEHMWDWKDLIITIKHIVKPVRYLALRIAIKAAAKVDYAPRKDTILKIFHLDITDILSKEPATKEITTENGKLKYIEYTYILKEKQFGLFDLLTIRLYDEEKVFRKDIRTFVTLHSKNRVQSKDKTEFAERLLRLFGSDGAGGEELMRIEKILIRKRLWQGRFWNFNTENGLHNHNNPGEKEWYAVELSDLQMTGGFHLKIYDYNKLIAHFDKA